MIFDASVAVKWLLQEADSAQALDLLTRTTAVAPDCIAVEVGHVLTRNVRRREITPAQATLLWADFNAAPLRKSPSAPLMDDALALSLSLNASFYDCLYLALASRRTTGWSPPISASSKPVRRAPTSPAGSSCSPTPEGQCASSKGGR